MRKLSLAVMLLAMNALQSARAADLLAPPLETLETRAAFGDICLPPPWLRGWSRMAPFVCDDSLWWPAYYYYGLGAGMGPRRPHHHR
jgi:hypothetical protein